MPGGHSTLNTVVLGEGISKSKYIPYFAYHSSARATASLYRLPCRRDKPAGQLSAGRPELRFTAPRSDSPVQTTCRPPVQTHVRGIKRLISLIGSRLGVLEPRHATPSHPVEESP
jgi:hypothetical protein